MFIWFYRILFLPVLLLSLPSYLLHIRKRGGYGYRFGTRFGVGLNLPAKREGVRRIWVQAVSLGEMLAIEPLLKGLAENPRNEIFLTVTTSTGYALAREKYGELAIEISYFPVDFWCFSRRVWRIARPDLAICAETELWPEHLRQARAAGVPFLLVNARLSDRSYRRMKRFRGWIQGPLRNISGVYACSEQDRERFVALGLAEDRVISTGNLKVDVLIEPRLSEEEKRILQRELGLGDGFVLLGSSTWPGEEAMLLQAWRRLREKLPDAKLLIVPRHGERRGELETWLREEAADLRWHFKSKGLPEAEVDVLIADTHGELRRLTQLAGLAFVGKTLQPHTEGQTPVECGALGVPILCGPGMSNFRSIRDGLRQHGALQEVESADDAIVAIPALCQDAERLEAMGQGGLAWHRASRGAVRRTLQGIDGWLGV